MKLIVHGDPVAKGSMRAFVPKNWSRAVVTAANPKSKQWETVIRKAAEEKWNTVSLLPFRVVLRFVMKRPKKLVREHHTVKPDIDKLTRCVLDALTSVVWKDDSQVICVRAYKRYADVDEEPHVSITASNIQ